MIPGFLGVFRESSETKEKELFQKLYKAIIASTHLRKWEPCSSVGKMLVDAISFLCFFVL